MGQKLVGETGREKGLCSGVDRQRQHHGGSVWALHVGMPEPPAGTQGAGNCANGQKALHGPAGGTRSRRAQSGGPVWINSIEELAAREN